MLDEIAWRPGFHDPYAIGWTITLAYFGVAVMCLTVWMQSRKRRTAGHLREHPFIWLLLSSLLFLLCINKQLDLQTLLIEYGRMLAVETKWYESRRQVQLRFVQLLAGAGVFSILGFVGYFGFYKSRWKEIWPIAIGLSLITLFVLIRAASFNHVDHMLSQWRVIGPFRMKYIVELVGITTIGAGACTKLRLNRFGK